MSIFLVYNLSDFGQTFHCKCIQELSMAMFLWIILVIRPDGGAKYHCGIYYVGIEE